MNDPDFDIEAKRLALSLRESNLAVHRDRTEAANHLLSMARDLLDRVPMPETPAALLMWATAAANIAAGLGSIVQADFMLEAEQASVDHERAHFTEYDEHIAQREKIRETADAALADLRDRFRAQGIDVEQMPGGIAGLMGGIIIRPPDDRPNS